MFASGMLRKIAISSLEKRVVQSGMQMKTDSDVMRWERNLKERAMKSGYSCVEKAQPAERLFPLVVYVKRCRVGQEVKRV